MISVEMCVTVSAVAGRLRDFVHEQCSDVTEAKIGQQQGILKGNFIK